MRKLLTEAEAKSLKMGRLTTPYSLPREGWMLKRVLEDMVNGNIDHALVETTGGVEVWRTGIIKPGSES